MKPRRMMAESSGWGGETKRFTPKPPGWGGGAGTKRSVGERKAPAQRTRGGGGGPGYKQRRKKNGGGGQKGYGKGGEKKKKKKKKKPLGERLLRVLQWQIKRRMPQPGDLLQLEGSASRHRAMAQSLQYHPTAFIAQLQAARAPDVRNLDAHLDEITPMQYSLIRWYKKSIRSPTRTAGNL